MRPANLFEAIESGDAAALATLLAADADVDEIDFHQYQATPLAHACARGATAMVQALLAAGAEPSFAAFTPPLVAAATHGFADIVALLLAAGADVDAGDESGMTALWIASARGFADIARSLAGAGARRDLADGDGVPPQLAAAENGHTALAAWLANPDAAPADPALWSAGRQQAEDAARTRRAEVAAAADRNAADPGHAPPARWTIKGGMATHDLGGARVTQDFPGVAASGHAELVQAMLDAGLAVEWTLFKGHPTALMTAARTGDAAMVELLLARGANPRAVTEKGLTALHLALFEPAARRHLPVLQALLAAGADPDAADADGQRPLHLALRHGIPALVQALIEAGANPFLRDRAGRCPADWAPAGTGRNAKAIAAQLAQA